MNRGHVKVGLRILPEQAAWLRDTAYQRSRTEGRKVTESEVAREALSAAMDQTPQAEESA